jgi:hypothetical protein
MTSGYILTRAICTILLCIAGAHLNFSDAKFWEMLSGLSRLGTHAAIVSVSDI